MQTKSQITRKAYRNKKLAARFYFYNDLMGLRFEVCLNLLEKEFDISPATIADLISKNGHEVEGLRQAKQSIKSLKKKYPFMSWRYLHANLLQN